MALGLLAEKRVVIEERLILNLLESSNLRIRYAALEYLLKVRSTLDSVRAGIEKLVKDENTNIVAKARQVLGYDP